MKYKVLVENDKYRLIMERGCDYNYVVLFKGRRGFLQEVVRSWGLIKKVTCYFTGIEIHEAKERRNLIEYVNHIILS